MPDQGELALYLPGDRPARARRKDPESSHAAADRLERSGRAGEQLRALVAAVLRYPGRTTRELAGLPGVDLDRYQLARRAPEAEEAGWIERKPSFSGGDLRLYPGRRTRGNASPVRRSAE